MRNVSNDGSNPDKVTPVGADRVVMIDSETAPNSLKEITFTNFGAWWASLTATLTNKTLSLASNVLTGTLAQLNAAITDADVASLAGAESLTNKTLVTPTIASFLNAAHNHADAAGGGLISVPVQDWTPTFTGFTLGNGVLVAKYAQVGKLVAFHLSLVMGTTSVVSGSLLFSVPVTPLTFTVNMPIGVARFKDATGGNAQQGATQIQVGSSNCAMLALDSSGTYATATVVNATIPFTWAVSDDLEVSGVYLAA